MLVPPMLLNHVLVGVLLLPLGGWCSTQRSILRLVLRGRSGRAHTRGHRGVVVRGILPRCVAYKLSNS